MREVGHAGCANAVVPVWRMDRYRRSVTDLPATLREFEHRGVGFVFLNEAPDLTTSAGRVIAALLAVFAAFKKEILQERARAGLAHARQNGKRSGRPISAALHAGQMRELFRAGANEAGIARELQTGRISVRHRPWKSSNMKLGDRSDYAALPKGHAGARRTCCEPLPRAPRIDAYAGECAIRTIS